MKNTWVRNKGWVIVALLLCYFGGAGSAMAQTVTSPNYQITEPEFGSNMNEDVCSGEYCAKATIGSLTDEQGSRSYTTSFGPIATDSEPMLEVIIEDGQSNLGVLSTERTATKTTIVRVRNYLSDGYLLYINGRPPVYKNHFLTTSAEPVASAPGQEQFGINVVANSAPEIGEDPQQVPSAEISFGEIEPNYQIPNSFMYQDGAVIARSLQETGRTDYTVSMIVNVSNQTPAGHFTSDFSAVVVPVF